MTPETDTESETASDLQTPPPPPPTDAAPPASADPPQPTQPEKPPWYYGRIAELTKNRASAEERAERAEREAREARELLARMQSGQQTQPQTQPPNQQDDRRAEIAAEAARQRFYEDTVDVRNRGIAQLGAQFTDALNILASAGATTDEFIADVLAVDKAGAHELIANLAKDAEKVIALRDMDSRRRIAELTRITMASKEPTPPPAPPNSGPAPAPAKQVSKAPAPAPRIEPSTTRNVDWRSDAATDEEFNRGFFNESKWAKSGTLRR